MVQDTLPLIPLKTTPRFRHIYLTILASFWRIPGSPLSWVSWWSVTKTIVTNVAKCHPTERQASKNISVFPHPPCSQDLVPSHFWLLFKVKMVTKGQHFASVQHIKAVVSVQPQILKKEDFRSTSERGKNDGIGVFEARGIFRGWSKEYVSFTIINIVKI